MRKHRVRVGGLGVLCLWLFCLCPVPVSRTVPVQAVTRSSEQISWPTHYFAPYSYDTSQQTDLVALAQAGGTRFFTLAFIESGKDRTCQASWNTRQPVGSWMHARIDALRAMGGDVRVAFGGSANSELAAVCKTLPVLQAQYQVVIDTYGLTHLDFDIEGQTLTNARATDLRNRAIAALQKQAARQGRQLTISYTLPVKVTGLTWSALNLLRNAVQNGVRISVVNLMTMDYYSQHAPGEQMGQNAIAAAQSVFGQLQHIYPTASAAQLWHMLGLTPMIGVNDNPGEVFTLGDAQTVESFAERQHLHLLAFWSIQRDRACAGDQVAPHGCTGVAQQPGDYSQAFAAFFP